MQSLPTELFRYISDDGWQRIHNGKTRLVYAWLDGDIRAFEAELGRFHLQDTEHDHDQSTHGNWADGGGKPAPGSPTGAEAKKTAIEKVGALKESLIGETVEGQSEDDDDYTPEPDSWDAVPASQQEETKEQWEKDHWEEFLQGEIDNYWEESYRYDAQRQIWEDQRDWARDRLVEILDAHGVDLEKSGLLDKDGNLDDKVFGKIWDDQPGEEAWDKSYSSSMSLKDNSDLINPEILGQLVNEDGEKLVFTLDPNQPQLSGTPEPGDPISQNFTQRVLSDFEDTIRERINDAADWMSDPDSSYFEDSINEMIGEYFEQKSDSEKFDLAKDQFGDDWAEAAGKSWSGEPVEIVEPNEYKVLSDGQDYERTKNLGNALTEARFEEVLKERGILDAQGYLAKVGQEAWWSSYQDINEKEYIQSVWRQWKSHSAKGVALALHLASAEELGGYFYQINDMTAKDIRTWANAHLDGGFDGLKAYVRAQWEVNQYLLDKAGVDHLDLFRAVMIDGDLVNKEIQNINLIPYGGYQALPTLFLHQNGAASFSTLASVSNGWSGVGTLPPNATRVVIRARVPASAVLSLPVFGKNIHSEQEVVVTGLPWKSWDAWKGTAPGFSEFDILHPRGPDGRFIEKPDWQKVDAKANAPSDDGWTWDSEKNTWKVPASANASDEGKKQAA